MTGVSFTFEFRFFKFTALGLCGCSILLIDNLEYLEYDDSRHDKFRKQYEYN